MRRLLLGAAAALVVGATASADPGAWQVRDSSSALDGAHDYGAALESDNEIAGDGLHGPKPALTLTCNHNGFVFAFDWPAAVDRDPHEPFVIVAWKLDDGPVRKSPWLAAAHSVGLPGSMGFDLARKWSAGRTLIVRVPARHGGQEATFQLAGLDQIVARVSQMNCG